MLTYVYIGSLGLFENVYVNKINCAFYRYFFCYVISANIKKGGFFFISNVKGMYVLLRLNH